MNNGGKFSLWVSESLHKNEKIKTINSYYNNGGKRFLIYNDPDAKKEIIKKEGVEVYAIVPDITKYVRDMTKYGMVGMGVRKVMSLGIINIIKLGFKIVPKFKGILNKNFKVLLPILVQIDYFELKKIKPRYLFLHSQITDLALANNNKGLINKFLELKTGCNLGLMTKNLGFLEKKSEEWGLTINNILAPFNQTGYEMRPTKKKCEEILLKNKRNYFSFNVLDSDVQLQKEIKYLERLDLKEKFISF